MGEYVYILINQSMPGLVKIGRTDRNPEDRAKELSSTGVPSPFMVAYEHLVIDSRSAEAVIHAFLSSQGHRPSANREFFNIPLKLAISIVSKICQEFENSEFPTGGIQNRSDDPSRAADDFYNAGLDFYHGYGNAIQSYPKALESLELSYKLGNLAAADCLSNIYLWGLSGRSSPEKALELLHEAASRGEVILYLKLAEIYLGVERDPEFEKDTLKLKNIDNAVKCYERYFSNEITPDARIKAVFDVLGWYSRVLGAPYPERGSWLFLERELLLMVQIARDALLEADPAVHGGSSNGKNFLKIVSEIDDGVSRDVKKKLLEQIFSDVDIASFRSLLRNLPEKRISVHEAKFSAYIHNASKNPSGFLKKLLG